LWSFASHLPLAHRETRREGFERAVHFGGSEQILWRRQMTTIVVPVYPCSICGIRPNVRRVGLETFRGRYAVDSSGGVWNVRKNPPFELSRGGNGPYERVVLQYSRRKLPIVPHKLVALTFSDLVPGWHGGQLYIAPSNSRLLFANGKYYEVDHHDGNRRHNCIHNLRVVTPAEHRKRSYEKGER
jgi:hypothetical protein